MTIKHHINLFVLLLITFVLSANTVWAARTTSYQYNSFGQVTQIDGPRTDVSDITTFVYDATSGNLTSVTNALGQPTNIPDHDAHGRPLTLMDPNNVPTTLTYDLRGRLLTRTVAGQPTTFAYDGVGNITQLTLPTGAFIQYAYDAAQRLIGITDNLGNKIDFTLDAAGNRTKDDVKDPLGVLTRTQSRVFNSLSQLTQVLGGVNQSTAYAYDANGNPITITDGLNQPTNQAFDALNRLTTITDATTTGITQYTYDARDNLTSVKDPNGNITNYTYDGLDNLTQQTSPDTGTTNFTHDDAGNVVSQTDARGIIVNFTYDALNRLATKNYVDNSLDVTLSYDTCPNGIGRLCKMSDASGTTNYSYDARGNVIQTQTVMDGITTTIGYTYNGADQVTQITYPSTRTVDYTHNSIGQIASVASTFNSVIQPLASSITYQPFGPVNQFTYGNGFVATRSYDLEGRLIQTALPQANTTNTPPTANAGPNQSVNGNTSVSLDGTASSDSDGTIASYNWTQTVGIAVTLTGATTANPSFTAPATPGTLTFDLVVTDNKGATSTADSVNIVVNAAPTANAGPDQTVNASATVNLNGTASSDSDGTIASYSWIQTPSSTVTLNNAATANPSFTAPATAGTLTFQLTVTDNNGASNSDTVNIVVNAAPTANAGPDQTVNAGDSVTLNGTASTDSDGTIASYSWTQTAGTTVTLTGATTVNPSFTAPATAGTLIFQLTVTDNNGATSTADSVNIIVNVAPTANAGLDQTVNASAAVNLNGTASSDSDGTIASYSWTQTAGTTVTLTGATTATPSFTAPATAETLTFDLVVTDNNGATSPVDSVNIAVQTASNTIPTVTISTPASGSSFTAGTPITFTGTASDVEDGDLSANLAWSSDLDGAIGSGASFSTSTLSVGSHVITATVTDSGGLTPTPVPSVTLTVNASVGRGLVFSTSSDRSGPMSLNGATVTGNIYIFVNPATDVQQAWFFQVDTAGNWNLLSTDSTPPFDLSGGTTTTANPFDTTTLANGPATFAVEMLLADGSFDIITANITVGGTSSLSPSTTSFASADDTNSLSQEAILSARTQFKAGLQRVAHHSKPVANAEHGTVMDFPVDPRAAIDGILMIWPATSQPGANASDQLWYAGPDTQQRWIAIKSTDSLKTVPRTLMMIADDHIDLWRKPAGFANYQHHRIALDANALPPRIGAQKVSHTAPNLGQPVLPGTQIYNYDPNGNVKDITTPQGDFNLYSYDVLNRLIQDALDNHIAIDYGYDANGNRLSETQGATAQSYTYQPGTNLLTNIDSNSLTHDAAGNRTSDQAGNRTFIYNDAGRLSQVNVGGLLTATYTYNGLGQRVKKVTASATSYYHYDLNGQLLGETDATGAAQREYVHLNGEPLAQMDVNGVTESITYLYPDHLGTPRRGTDATGTLVWYWESEAFGEEAASGTVTVNLRFAGQYFDAETGLHQNWFRYYDPQTGRYITSDPIGIEGGLNTYAYVSSNPINRIDPFGLFVVNPVTVAAVEATINLLGIGAVVGSGLSVGNNSSNDDGGSIVDYQIFKQKLEEEQNKRCKDPDGPDECELVRNALIIAEIKIKEDARGAPSGANEIAHAANIRARKIAWNKAVDTYNGKCPRKIGRRFKV